MNAQGVTSHGLVAGISGAIHWGGAMNAQGVTSHGLVAGISGAIRWGER